VSKAAKKTIEMPPIIADYLSKHMVLRRGAESGNHQGVPVPKAAEKKPNLSRAEEKKAEQNRPPLKPADTGLDGSATEWRRALPRHDILAAAVPNKIKPAASTPVSSYATHLSEEDLDPDWGFETLQFGDVGESSVPTAAAIADDE